MPGRACGQQRPAGHRHERSELERLVSILARPPFRPPLRLLKEVGEPLGGALPVVCVLQLLPGSPDLARYARDGSGPCEPDLETSGSAGIDTGSVPALHQRGDSGRFQSAATVRDDGHHFGQR